MIAGVSPHEPPISDLNGNYDSSIELDFDNASTVNQAFEENEIDYLFLIPSKSEERALEAKRYLFIS